MLHSNDALCEKVKEHRARLWPSGPWEVSHGISSSCFMGELAHQLIPIPSKGWKDRGNREQDRVMGERRRGWEEGLVESV